VGGILANLATGYVVSPFSYNAVFAWAGLMHPVSLLLLWRLLPVEVFERREIDSELTAPVTSAA
jgi:hypothetical protein